MAFRQEGPQGFEYVAQRVGGMGVIHQRGHPAGDTALCMVAAWLEELVGDGPWAAGRLYLTWNIKRRHGLRLLLAPLSYTETGTFDEPVDFALTR